ncbi:rab-GTPase-TBC domain-containing protein [Parasitella parasitica]|nr:rab-GTPase-TBC domain-containing protein [Parasitella parasitica]
MATLIPAENNPLELAPQVLEKLQVLETQQHKEQANMIRPTASKSADNKTTTQLVYPEKSTSLSLAERRKNNNKNIPASFQLYPTAVDTKVSDQYIIKQLDRLSKLDSMKAVTVTPLLKSFTTTEPIWENFIKNATIVKERLDLLKFMVANHGIPEHVRGQVWQAICQTSSESEVAISYHQFVNQPCAFDAMIDKDVQCLPANQQESAGRILKAYSLYDTRVGYYQGMAKLLSPILANMPEIEAFALFVRLLQTFCMEGKRLDLCLQQFQTILAQQFPELSAHFFRLSVQPHMYASMWYKTLCSCLISSQQHMMRLYDIAFLEGAVETVIRATMVLVGKNQQRLLSMNNLAEILSFLNTSQMHSFAYNKDADGDLFIQDIMALDVAVPEQRPVLRASSTNNKKKHTSTQTIPVLQQQVEDLAAAMAQIQKEHSALLEENKALKMHEMDQDAAQTKLAKRNAVLEKRVKKYRTRLAELSSNTVDSDESNNAGVTAAATNDTGKKERRQDQYTSFVASLRDTGDFGALIAGALAPALDLTKQDAQAADTDAVDLLQNQQQQQQTAADEEEDAVNNKKKLDAALQNVTSELVAVKLDHFETSQRYESLYHHCQELTAQMQSMQESHTTLLQKIIYLESELEDVQTERDNIFQDQEEVLAMAMVAKKTAAELQLEKMTLSKEVERLEQCVKDLQEEKKAYFMPRNSFSEEVFAAHSILFGQPTTKKQQQQQQQQQQQSTKELNRRHTLQIGKNTLEEEYKTKFVESELRCRELEKYLAETKVRLAELESSSGVTTSSCSIISPRGSLQQHRRASSSMIHNTKRSSTASLSMLANRVGTPTSPRERRESTESYASDTTSLTSMNSSNYNSKRSSVYSRIWNAFGSPTTPMNPVMMKTDIMCDEPRIIEHTS